MARPTWVSFEKTTTPLLLAAALSLPPTLHLTGADARREQEAVARWLLEALGPAYGPHGGLALVRGADGTDALVPGGAAALREAAADHPAIKPYVQAADGLHGAQGDGATGALLLAAELVLRGLELSRAGVPVAAYLDGLELARRQARGVLRTLVEPDDGRILPALRQVAPDLPPEAAQVVWAGLPDLLAGDRLDLEAIDVVVSPPEHQEAWVATWLPGVVVEPRSPLVTASMAPPTRVVLLGDGARPSTEATARLADPREHGGWIAAEAAWTGKIVARLDDEGVGLVACARGVPDDLADALETAGIIVVTDVRRSTMERLARATGAESAPRWSLVDRGAFGEATVEHWRDRLAIQGARPSATLHVPAATAAHQPLMEGQAESLLRAAGALLADPGVVPGGGRWQRHLAKALRDVADHAPGKTPFGVQAAADALDALAARLVIGEGGDPLANPLPRSAEAIWDAATRARGLLQVAFDLAGSMLRLDGRHARRASNVVGLRGSDGKVGSPSGLPGDVPPHI